jgi:gluconokinase
MIILLMGVSGVGKTAVGEALAQHLHWRFVDADDFHPATNVAKMRAGIALDDADRAPWLQALHNAIVGWIAAPESVVLACSALKEAYRRELIVGPEVKLVFLHADISVVGERVAQRQGHVMTPALLQSQFDTLEAPGEAISIDASKTISEIVAAICSAVGLRAEAGPAGSAGS